VTDADARAIDARAIAEAVIGTWQSIVGPKGGVFALPSTEAFTLACAHLALLDERDALRAELDAVYVGISEGRYD
jgi:hypothetical protein